MLRKLNFVLRLGWLLRMVITHEDDWVPSWPLAIIILINLIINLHVVILNLNFCIGTIKMGVTSKNSKILCSTLLLFFSIWIILVRPNHNSGILKVGVNTKNWYKEETVLWAEFGRRAPFGKRFSSKYSVKASAVGSMSSFGRRAVSRLEGEAFGNA
jgi:hypothetical protein